MVKSKTYLMRVSPKTMKFCSDMKNKNRLKSLTEAADRMTDFMTHITLKKKMKEKIIREIEF